MKLFAKVQKNAKSPEPGRLLLPLPIKGQEKAGKERRAEKARRERSGRRSRHRCRNQNFEKKK